MKKVRFAPSPTGSLHVGNALSAVANRRLGDWMLLRIDDTDPRRNVPGGEEAILRDLEWLGIVWDEGPVRQSERAERHRELGAPLGDRFEGITLLREDGSPTYQLASVVGVPVSVAPVLRGARDLAEAREYAALVLEPAEAEVDSPETLTRARELVEAGLEPRAIVRELKAVGGDLKALRLALTGRDRGPELAAVIAALPRGELLSRLER